MKISEIFYSVQGEGKLVGVPSVLVRTSGCHLRCAWCDTPYASWQPEGHHMSVDQIVAKVGAYPTRHIVLTGGEPLIASEITELCLSLKHAGYHLTVETAATVFLPLALDLASVSPKLANSTPTARDGGRWANAHESQRLNLPVIQSFIDSSPDFQLKFVITQEADVHEIRQILASLHGWTAPDVLLMPEGTDAATLATSATWIVALCKHEGFRFCPRMQVMMWGNRRGT